MKEVKIGILGLGVVAQGFLEMLTSQKQRIEAQIEDIAGGQYSAESTLDDVAKKVLGLCTHMGLVHADDKNMKAKEQAGGHRIPQSD